MSPVLITVIILALVFNFLNGIHDSSNIVATMISSRAFSPRVALTMTAVAEFSGPLIFGVAVAKTIGHDIVYADAINNQVLLAASHQRHPVEPIHLVPGLSQQFFPCSYRGFYRSGTSLMPVVKQ